MSVQLSEDLALELERAGNSPLHVENPRTHKRYVIIAEEQFSPAAHQPADGGNRGEWSAAHNARRFVLIDKEIAGTLSPAESAELQTLQRQIDEYLRQAAPLPAIQDLHESLRLSLANSPRSA